MNTSNVKHIFNLLTLMFACLLLSVLVLLTKLPEPSQPIPLESGSAQQAGADPLNTTYLIEGNPAVLVNGAAAQVIVPGSASQSVTRAWGEPVVGDLNEDGVADAALMLTRDGGGSGTFFYVVAALKHSLAGTFRGTNAVLLGDRLAPQNISISSGVITVNYAERESGEPMTAQPSVGRSAYLVVSSNGALERMGPNTVEPQ